MGWPCRRTRGVRSPGALFVLLWNLLLFSYHQSALGNLVSLVVQDKSPWVLAIISAVLTDLLPKMLYPFAGWLADAKLGRYKVMRYSLWVIWMGSVLLILACLVRYILSDSHVVYMVPVFVVVYLINIVGIAGYHVNVIPFGIDQMEGASGEQITAFLQWYYWTRNVNFGVIIQLGLEFMPGFCDDSDLEAKEPEQKYELIIIIIQMFFLTAALCLDFLFSSKLHKDVKIHNPVKKVKDISIFILKHNRPVGRRSAYTFTYSTPPTRSDFAKQSYGGPFEDDEVEEVVSFWRIVLFLLAIGIGGFLIQTGYYNYATFFDHMQSEIPFLPPCRSKNILVTSIYFLSFTFSIPTFEFLIYPFIRNRIPGTKVRIFLSMCILLLGLLALLSIDITGHLKMSTTTSIETCIFYEYGQSQIEKLPIDSFVLVPIMFMMAVGEMLFGISIFEFICAQAPHGMRGLIIGIFYMIYGVNVGLLLSLVLAAFSLGYLHHAPRINHLSCETLYLLGVVVLGCVGVALYVVAARCYNPRQRGGQRDENEQTTLEGYYESQRIVQDQISYAHTDFGPMFEKMF